VRRSARFIALCLAAVAALAVAGCGNRQEVRTVGDTEGIYIDVDDLKYQVQISRILNPADVEDKTYLRGLSEGVAPAKDEVWFAVFMRVQNETDRTLTPADQFEITDTTDRSFRPLNLDANDNAFIYKPTPLPPGQLIPEVGSIASDSTIQGSLILFKLKVESLSNRPLELKISSSRGGTTGIVDLDV
jgi:hypothetical protein